MKIHQIKNIFPTVDVARYNLAAWQNQETESVYFIGREVAHAAARGEPDVGLLKLFEISADDTVVQEKVIWKPVHDGISLEDPRAFESPNGNLHIGLTAVLRDKAGQATPFPAVVKIDSVKTWKQELPPVLIIETFGPGKNLTPIDSHRYLFRPDATEYNHRLLAFSLNSQIPEKITDISFPANLPWADWRIGTTMPPIWQTPTTALMIFHGITIQKIDGKPRYVYSLGRCKLTCTEHVYRVEVAPEPILTPQDFMKDGKPLVEELHPELRQVVYSCGGIIKKQSPDTLSLYVNVGDRSTFEVEILLSELTADLF